MLRIFVMLLTLAPSLLFAQFSSSIRTGRPGQAIGAYSLGKAVFQSQNGLTHIRNSNGNRALLASNVFRLGLSKKFEISTVVQHRNNDIRSDQAGLRGFELTQTQVGARLNLLSNRGLIPALAIQARVQTQGFGQKLSRSTLGANFVMATHHSLGRRWGFNTNINLNWAKLDSDIESSYIANVTFAISKRLGTFVEIYGPFHAEYVNVDGGLGFLISPDVQLDLSVGRESRGEIYYVDGGISWRLDWRERS